jgi:hypothetical protein
LMIVTAMLNCTCFWHCFTNTSLKKSPEQNTFLKELAANSTELFLGGGGSKLISYVIEIEL